MSNYNIGLGQLKAALCCVYQRIASLTTRVTVIEQTGGGGGGGGSVPVDSIWDAKGDLAVGTGPNTAVRLAVGVNGYVLIADSSQPTGLRWGPQTGTGSSSVSVDPIYVAKGDIPVGTGSGAAVRLPAGSNGYFLSADSTEPTGLKWVPISTGGGGDVSTDTLWNAKGDLAVGTGVDAASRLAVGTNGHVLMADSAEPFGVKWSPAYTDALIVTTPVSSLTLNASNAWPNVIRCTSNVGVTATIQDGQTAFGRYWILRQVGLGVISVSSTNSASGAVTRNGNHQSAGQNTSLSCFLVAADEVDIEGGVP